MSSNIENNNFLLPLEIMYGIFEFCNWKDNCQNALVCRSWKDIANEVAKKQFILQFKSSLEQQAKGFLSMVQGSLEDYCPKLKKIINEANEYTFKRISNELSNLPERDVVCLAGCFIVDPNCNNIPLDKKNDIAGKVFAELHYKLDGEKSWDGKEDYRICIWGEGKGQIIKNKRSYFPIELFNLKIDGLNQKIIGEKDSGEFCFVLGGKIIVFNFDPLTEKARDARFINPWISRDNAPIVNLTSENVTSGYIWPYDLYIPRLDAAPRDAQFKKS